MPRLLNVVLTAVVAAFLSASAVSAAEDPTQPVRSVTSDVHQISNARDGAEREAAIARVLHDNFDLGYLARAVLGTHWNEASQEQRARFVAALEASEARAYSERLGVLASYNVTVQRVTARADGGWTVDSSATGGVMPIKLAWDVRDSGQGPRIVDVKVEGVSMFATQRSEYNAYIRRTGSIEPLVAALEAKANR
jgi:phospholipid transport system substrate-binding protein